MINQAKMKILMQRKLDKQGQNKIHGLYDADGRPLVHELNYIDNNLI